MLGYVRNVGATGSNPVTSTEDIPRSPALVHLCELAVKIPSGLVTA